MKRRVFFAFLAGLILFPTGGMPAQTDQHVQLAELTPEAERAIDRGLRYLLAHQNADGSFGNRYPCGMTGLALMAFMVKGHFPQRGIYGQRLEKAVTFLLEWARLRGSGYFGGNMYEHGLATLALSEVWGMSDRSEICDVLKQAVRVIIQAQNPQGGWRYQPRPLDADISVTVMQIVALASAQEAGIHVPAETIARARQYVKSLQVPDVGGFGYQGPGGPSFARSAAGVLALQMTGERNSRAVLAGLTYLRRYPATKFAGDHYYWYAHYYAVQAMYQAGETYYQQWYPLIRDALIAKQRDSGGWGDDHDIVYPTCMAILTLGVPYRFLPIYQR